MTEDETAGWHHQPNGHEIEQTWEIVKDREASMACCPPWGRRVGYNLATQQQCIFSQSTVMLSFIMAPTAVK